MCRSSIGWSDTHHPLISRNHTDSSNPIASAGVVCGQTGTFKTPVFWRLEKRLDLGSATRNATPHSAMHRASMGATNGQRNWPKMRKTLGKPGFLSGEDRSRTFERFPNVLLSFERCYPWFCGLLWQMHQPSKSDGIDVNDSPTAIIRIKSSYEE